MVSSAAARCGVKCCGAIQWSEAVTAKDPARLTIFVRTLGVFERVEDYAEAGECRTGTVKVSALMPLLHAFFGEPQRQAIAEELAALRCGEKQRH